MGDLATITPEQARQWPKPEPLAKSYERLPYPITALPDLIRDAVNEVGGYVQAPTALVASSALSAVSLATQAHVDVARDEKLSGPVSLYLFLLADSGERKSTVHGQFTRAIEAYEQQQRTDKAPDVKRYTAENESHKAKVAGVLQKIKQLSKDGKPTQRHDDELKELSRTEPQRPKVPRLLVVDTTQEQLLYRLANEWPSAGLLSDEGGSVFGGHAMGKDSVMRFLATLNSLYGGTSTTVDRRTSESFTVENPRLTVHIQVQSPTLQEFLSKNGELARGSGFLARFLIADPVSTQGTRLYQAPPNKTPALDCFNNRIAQILARDVPMNERGDLEPSLMQLSPAAKQAWVDYHDTVESQLAAGCDFANIRDVASKSADNAVRLAALFAYFENQTPSTPISVEHMRSGVALATWHLFEAQRFFAAVSITPDQQDVQVLNEWLITHCNENGADRLTRRDISRLGPNRIRKDADRRDRALDTLAQHHRLILEKVGNADTVIINPALLSGGPA